jgi:hypothetical protein
MIAMKVTSELDIGLSFFLQAGSATASDRTRSPAERGISIHARLCYRRERRTGEANDTVKRAHASPAGVARSVHGIE